MNKGEFKVVKGATVYVNGIKIPHVNAYNISEGLVDAFASSPSGYSNKDLCGDDFIISRIYGHVETSWDKE